MSHILTSRGLAEDYWPSGLIPLSIEPYLPGRPTIPDTLEGIAERTVVEQYHKKGTDRTRHLGIFDAHKAEQQHLPIVFFGFIKYVSLTGYGNWNGASQTASRASLRLEVEGRGCADAFNPQLELMEHLRAHVTERLEAEDVGEQTNTLRFQHVLFRKVTSEENHQPFTIARGTDPTGKLARIARQWRLNPRPTFYKRAETGDIIKTTATSIAVNDFVQVTAHPDLIYTNGRGKTAGRVRIVLAIDSIIHLHSYQRVKEMQIPALLERQIMMKALEETDDETVMA